MAISDVLSKLAAGGFGNEVPRYDSNAMTGAPKLAQAILAFQNQQQASPAQQALSGLSSQWQTASPAQRTQLNQQADAARAAYLQSGGSPQNLPQNLWGSDPTQGFETGQGQFSPGYTGMEGYTMGQKSALAAAQLKAALDQMNERSKLSSITGIDPTTGQPTPMGLYRQAEIQHLMNLGSGKGGSSGGSGAATTKLDNWTTATGNVLSAIQRAQLNPPPGTTPVQTIEKQINDNRDYYISQGIDPAKLVDFAYEQIYGMTRAAYWKQADAALAQ